MNIFICKMGLKRFANLFIGRKLPPHKLDFNLEKR